MTRRRRCECGEGWATGPDGCPRCAWLDGVGEGAGPGSGEVIAELRLAGGQATLDYLVESLNVCERTVFRRLRPLIKSGRVQARWREDQSDKRPLHTPGHGDDVRIYCEVC